MPVDNQAKLAAIAALQSVHWEAQQLELALRMDGKFDEADEVWTANQRLSTEIDILIGDAVDKWVKQTATITADIQQSEQDLIAAIGKIQASVAFAKNVSKVIGLIDDVASLAAKLVL